MLGVIFYTSEGILVDSQFRFPTIEKKTRKILNVLVENTATIKVLQKEYLIVGEWVGELNQDYKWIPIRALEPKLMAEDKQVMSVFRQNFLEVVGENNEIMGIATVDEAQKYNLTRKIAYVLIFNKSGKLLFKSSEGRLDFPVAMIPHLWEDYSEAAERGLALLGIKTRSIEVMKGNIYNNKIRVNYTLYNCIGNAKSLEVYDLLDFKEGSDKFNEPLASILNNYARPKKQISSYNFKIVQKR